MTPHRSPAAVNQNDAVVWHTLDASEVAKRLGSDPDLGLSTTEAATRLAADGPNRLDEKAKTPAWRLFVSQYNDFMIYVLLVAVGISAFEGQVPESIAILAILLLNGVLGFVQEYRAEKALDALKQLSAPIATVIRDGAESDIPAEQLVAGDVVLLEAGDKVPADGRLVEAAALRVVESALTGESKPTRKRDETVPEADAPLGDRRDMVFAGTSVAVGRGRMIVTGTGQSTEMGKIADLLAATDDETTPLQKELAIVGKRIAVLVLVIAAIVFFEEAWVEWSKIGGSLIDDLGDPAFRAGLSAGLLVAVSLAVAAIPEGLPAIVTVSLSLGVRKMAERHAIVRKLHAVETLGSTTFICSDKTGTLTRNEMAVTRLMVGLDDVSVTSENGLEPAEARTESARTSRCCSRWPPRTTTRASPPTASSSATRPRPRCWSPRSSWPRVTCAPSASAEVPFDSERKRMTTIHSIDGALIAYMKGGADVVLALCTHARLRGEVVPLDRRDRARRSRPPTPRSPRPATAPSRSRCATLRTRRARATPPTSSATSPTSGYSAWSTRLARRSAMRSPSATAPASTSRWSPATTR